MKVFLEKTGCSFNPKLVYKRTLWPEPFKYVALPDPAITFEQIDASSLLLRTQRPAKGVWLTDETGAAQWSDNMIDLLPGEVYSIAIEGLNSLSSLRIDWLRG